MSFMDIITNKYVISIVGSLLALIFTYMYDKFERKDYPTVQYIKMAFVGYMVSLVSVVIAGYTMGLEGNEFPLPFTYDSILKSTSETQVPQTGGSTGGSTSGSTVPMNTTVIEPIQPKPITPSVQPRTSVNIDTLDFMTGTPTF
jgi:hypothetical protein